MLLEGWARDGLTDQQISDNIGISRSTLSAWKNKFQDISDALKKGKEIVDFQVENALLKRALGYDYLEERVGKDGVKITCNKHVPPDVTAIIFWLKNRRPDKWRDRPEPRLEEDTGGVIVLAPVMENPGPPEQDGGVAHVE